MDLISTLTEYIRQQMIGEIGADDNTTYIFNIHWMLLVRKRPPKSQPVWKVVFAKNPTLCGR